MPEPMVSATAFSKAAGVTPSAISDALKHGRLQAYSKSGRRLSAGSKGPKFFKFDEARKSFDESRVRPPTNGNKSVPPPRGLVLLTEQTKNLQNELLRMRIAREHGELIPRAAIEASDEATGAAIQRAHKAIPSWSEELVAAYQNGGLGAHSALLRVKSAELLNSIADLIAAEAERSADPEPYEREE